MAWKTRGIGNLRIDRVFKGVGRVAISSGTTDEKTYAQILIMLGDLATQGRTEDLEAIKTGTISPVNALARWKQGALKGGESIKVGGELKSTLLEWLEKANVEPTTKVGYRSSILQVCKLAKDGATLAVIPALLKKYREQCIANETFRAFNGARVTFLAFCRDQFGRNSDIYNQVRAFDLVSYKKQKSNNPFRVKELLALMEKVDENIGNMFWTMATTGMGPKEYIVDGFEAQADRIIVKGRKNDNRYDRIIPIVYQPAQPTVQYQAYRGYMVENAPNHTLYDLRRTYAVWMENAGILLSHRNAYMGHSAQKMSDLYTQQDMVRFLQEDATKLREWIEAERVKEDEAVAVIQAPAIPVVNSKPKQRPNKAEKHEQALKEAVKKAK